MTKSVPLLILDLLIPVFTLVSNQPSSTDDTAYSIRKILCKILIMAKILTQFLLLLAVSGFGFGCAPLPNTSEIIQNAASEQKTPRIASARGVLSRKQSQAILKRLKQTVAPTDILNRHVAVMETVSGTPLVKGNKAKLLLDGTDTFAAIFKAIEHARNHVNLETFIFEDDETGRRLANLLIRKQREGVQVNIIYDSVGCLNTPQSFFQRLRDNGIKVLEYNPINPLKVRKKWLINLRDHRKILVVDGNIAITGGVNISHVYSSRIFGSQKKAENKIPWRDTDVQIEGPAVAEFQKLFFSTWKWQKGPEVPEKNYFPVLKERGKDLVQVIKNSPGESRRATFVMYVSAITFAEKSIHLTNSYFVPDRQMVKALTEAAENGVDVKIILPKISDSSLALNAGRYYYAELLKKGVKLYELRDSVLHAKTAVIDDIWSTVGSTNMDFRSFSNNNEVNAVILSDSFAVDMEKMFDRDLKRSDQIMKDVWKKRGMHNRMQEWFAHLFEELL